MLKALGQALFSTGLQSPKFTPVEENKAEDYEVRTYHPTNWMSTSLTTMNVDEAMSTGFKRLFSYIQGSNKNKVKVEMTAPVTCLVEPGAGPACETTVTVSFYIPAELQDEPPQPSNPEVFLENRKELTVYVRPFGGYTSEQKRREEGQKLLESLQRDKVSYEDGPYYAVGYDSPLKLTNRRNEVWILKKTDQE